MLLLTCMASHMRPDIRTSPTEVFVQYYVVTTSIVIIILSFEKIKKLAAVPNSTAVILTFTVYDN